MSLNSWSGRNPRSRDKCEGLYLPQTVKRDVNESRECGRA